MKQGFDKRIVSYEHIHAVTPEDFEKLIDAVDPQGGEIILDAMCGYGAVGKAVLDRASGTEVYFLDESEVQIKRAKENLPLLNPNYFIVDSLPHDNFNEGTFDKIVIKMGLHEVSLLEHLETLIEFHRLLKPSGKLIVWDIMLDEATQRLFQDVVRKKDELAGFDMLTTERYFFREDEFLKNATQAGFKNIIDYHKISSNFSAKRRLESELGGDLKKLEILNQFVRDSFAPGLKSRLNYKDLGDDVTFSIPKKIFILAK